MKRLLPILLLVFSVGVGAETVERLSIEWHGGSYTGDVVNGWLPHGDGRLDEPDGSMYVGGWKFGLYHGRGMRMNAGGSSYVGEYKDGQWHGQGTWSALFKWSSINVSA